MSDQPPAKFTFARVPPGDASGKIFGPDDGNVFIKSLQDVAKGKSCDGVKESSIETLSSIYVSEVPEQLLDKPLMTEHFSQFGTILKVLISVKRHSCTIHFDTHENAKRAKEHGALLKGFTLNLYWSRPAKVTRRDSKHSEPSVTRGVSMEADSGHKELPVSLPMDQPTHTEAYRPPKDTKQHRARSLPVLELPMDVKDELDAMSGGDDARYLDRPTLLPDNPSPLPWRVKEKIKRSPTFQSKVTSTVKALLKSSVTKGRSPMVVGKPPSPILLGSSKTKELVVADKQLLNPTLFGRSKVKEKLPVVLDRPKAQEKAFTAVNRQPPKPTLSGRSKAKVATEKTQVATVPIPEVPTVPKSTEKELLMLMKQQAMSAEERYRVLEARDKLIRLGQSKSSSATTSSSLIGICPDMCPEKERYHRVARQQVAVFERLPSTDNEVRMDHGRAVKLYARSSADQEEPLLHELRPTPVLVKTMNYLLKNIVDQQLEEDDIQEWYHYLWDRTRSIRKDIAQQELCDHQSVGLVEQCARFHIHCSGRLLAEDPSVFDEKINTENLTKCLQTLKYMYDDLALNNHTCPNEAEFRGYMILLNLNDDNFIWDINHLRPEIRHSAEVKFALSVHSAIKCNNYVRFFKLVRQTSYLNACVLERYFFQVRSWGLLIIIDAHCHLAKQSLLPVRDLLRILAFEEELEALVFLDHFGLEVTKDKNIIIHKNAGKNQSSTPLQKSRATALIESKMTGTVGETIHGGPLPSDIPASLPVHSSFTSGGYLRPEVWLTPSAAQEAPVDMDQENVPTRKTVIFPATSRPTIFAHTFSTVMDTTPAGGEMETSSGLVFAPPSAPPVAVGSQGFSFTSPEAGFTFKVPEQVKTTASPSPWCPVSEKPVDGGQFKLTAVLGSSSGLPTLQHTIPVLQQSKLKSFLSPEEVSRRNTEERAMREKLEKRLVLEREKRAKEAQEKRIQEERERIAHIEHEKRVKEEQVRRVQAERERILQEECERRIQEERERRVQEEKEKERRRQAALTATADTIFNQLFLELTRDVCWKVLTVEQMLVWTSETCNTIIQEVLEDYLCQIAREILLQERVRVFSEKVKQKKMKAVCEKWLRIAKYRRRLREALVNFPALLPGVCASHKTTRLLKPHLDQLTRNTLSDADFAHILKDPNFSFSSVDLPSVVGPYLATRPEAHTSELFWKLLVSTPCATECPSHSDNLRTWTQNMFISSNRLSPQKEGVSLCRSHITPDIHLTTSVRCVVGRGKLDSIVTSGLHAALFCLGPETANWATARTRLHQLIEGVGRVPCPSLAVVTFGRTTVSSEDITKRLGLDNMVAQRLIADYSFFASSFYTPNHIETMVLKVLQWLSERAICTQLLVVQPLPLLLERLMSNAWAQITRTTGDVAFSSTLTQEPNNLLRLHNKCVITLLDYMVDPGVLKYSPGASEFEQFTRSWLGSYCLDLYQVCPEYFGTSQYFTTVNKVMKMAELPLLKPWPPTSLNELINIFESYCKDNGISSCTWDMFNYFYMAVTHFFGDKTPEEGSSRWFEFIRSIPWLPIVQTLVQEKLQVLDCRDPESSGSPFIAVVTRKNYNTFCNTFWWLSANEMITPTPHVNKENILHCTNTQLKRRPYIEDTSKITQTKKKVSCADVTELMKRLEDNLNEVKCMKERLASHTL
uniref:RRM domain-containing protein n=2 Tax=Timema TaxID=61471 RepID=A0A7R9IHJ5_9NEOP|nr:unnamed protein product [Timema tahoe]